MNDEIFGLDENGVPIVPNVLVDLQALTEEWEKERDVNSGPGPGHNLRNYWLRGEGAAKIRWNTDGDWTRCVRYLSKYVKDPKGLCSEYHHQATGMWPGDRRNRKMEGDTVTSDTKMLYDQHRAAEGGDVVITAASNKTKKDDEDEAKKASPLDPNNVKFVPVDDEDDESDVTEEPETDDDDDDEEDEEVVRKTSSAVRAAKARTVAAEMEKPARWEGILTVEGVESGDGRMFATNALTWDELPLPLRWQKESAHGGQNDVTVAVGNIEKIWREPSPDGRAGVTFIKGSGTIDLGNPDGREVYRRMKNGYMRGNSVDVDSVKGADVELIYPESVAGPVGDDEDDDGPAMTIFDMARMQPELTVYKKGRIRATTLVEIPAFTEARLSLSEDNKATDPAPDQPEQDDEDTGGELVRMVNEKIDAVVAAATTITITDAPPREWFDEPKDVTPTGALTVTPEGRIYGYVAPLGVRHRSFQNKDVRVPMRKVDYSRFMGGETIVADGGRVSTGAITMNCGHASTSPHLTAAQAAEHYDNTCSIVATVRVGENRHGVWMAGALLPDVTPDQIRRIMASRLSGDWRAHLDKPGWREFVAALLVPVPGFPMARTAPSVTTSEGALVAASVPVHFLKPKDEDEDEVDTTDVETEDDDKDEDEDMDEDEQKPTPKMKAAAVAARVRVAKIAALQARVSAFHGNHNQSTHGHRYGPDGKLTSPGGGGKRGTIADRVKAAKERAKAAPETTRKNDGGSAKNRMDGAGPDGWKERKDGGFMKHNPASGSDHLVRPASDGSGKWEHNYVGKGEKSVTSRRFDSKEQALADADRVIQRDGKYDATGTKRPSIGKNVSSADAIDRLRKSPHPEAGVARSSDGEYEIESDGNGVIVRKKNSDGNYVFHKRVASPATLDKATGGAKKWTDMLEMSPEEQKAAREKTRRFLESRSPILNPKQKKS